MTHGIHPPWEEGSVRPSSVLIDELHRRLFDPGVVSAFEREHRRGRVEDRNHHSMDRVVRPRWALLPAVTAAADDGGEDGSIVVEATTITVRDNVVVKQRHEDANNTMPLTRRYQSNDNTDDELYELEKIIDPRYSTNDTKRSGDDERYDNGIPTRNYIDLRMEQNRIFADDQSRKCNDILSTIKLLYEQQQHTSCTKERSSSSSTNNNNDNNNDELVLEKHAKLLHSLLYEGLCACPNHVGLLRVRTNYAEWLRRGRNVEMSDDTCTKSTLISRHNDTQFNNSSINVTGVEGRTHAAMHDVRTERSFLTHGGGGGGDHGDATMIRGYSLLPPTAIDDTIVMYDVAAVKDGRRKNSFEHHGESNGNESPPYRKERRQRRRKHDRRRRRRRGKDDRSCKRRRRIEYELSSSSLLHDRHHCHRRRSQSCESSGSNRSEVSRSSSYTHSSSSSSSSYSRRRKHRHRKEEKKSRRSSKGKAKKSKKSKHYHHHRKSRSCDTVEEGGNNDGCGRNTGGRSVGKSEEAMFC